MSRLSIILNLFIFIVVFRNTSRLFLIASQLFEVLTVFGEISEDIARRVKYAKWKAIYISRCLKNGEIPVPGPVAGTDADDFGFSDIPSANEYSNTNIGEQKPNDGSNVQMFPSYPTVPSVSSATQPSNEYISGGTHTAITAMSKK